MSNVNLCYDFHSAFEKKKYLTNKSLFTQTGQHDCNAHCAHLNHC